MSDYEIDLSAFGSDTEMEGATVLHNIVPTSEIDGPTDFTINMNQHMRGRSASNTTKKEVATEVENLKYQLAAALRERDLYKSQLEAQTKETTRVTKVAAERERAYQDAIDENQRQYEDAILEIKDAQILVDADRERDLEAAAAAAKTKETARLSKKAARREREITEAAQTQAKEGARREHLLTEAAQAQKKEAARRERLLLEAFQDAQQEATTKEAARRTKEAARRESDRQQSRQELLTTKQQLGKALKIITEMKEERTKMEEARAESAAEREIMVDTLMHLWGQEEFGKESPQRFRYKYARKA